MRPRALLPLLVVALLAALVPAAQAVRGFGAVADNPADRLASLPMDPFRYDHSTHCGKRPRAGTVSLQHWLERHARGVSWGIMRCEKLSAHDYSLHADGRALDWHLDVHDPAQRREASRLIHLLLAPDQDGRPAALAARMGVQEIIWDCRAWWAGSDTMGRYSVCGTTARQPRKVDDTTAHRNHIHFGLNFRGAAKKTSFWRQ